MNWTQLLVMNWPGCSWLRTARDVEGAAGEIRLVINRNPPSNEELCAVIRWMAGPEGNQERPPSLRQLIRAVFIRRKAEGSTDVVKRQGCGLCRKGWHEVSPNPNKPFYTSMVPCRCDLGNWTFDMVRDYRDLGADQVRRLDALRDRAMDEARRSSAGVSLVKPRTHGK